MKRVSIQDLKRNLSAVLAEAAEREPVLVTRHGKPLVELTAAGLRHVVVGVRHGRGSLRPHLSNGSGGRYFDLLVEDRRGGPDR